MSRATEGSKVSRECRHDATTSIGTWSLAGKCLPSTRQHHTSPGLQLSNRYQSLGDLLDTEVESVDEVRSPAHIQRRRAETQTRRPARTKYPTRQPDTERFSAHSPPRSARPPDLSRSDRITQSHAGR
ncbi:hypothetical protein Bbelb_053930 [Branchiostoma belcheri]|nr:hypothetical protein Bbelb_053930 [Branchiostoma belcheri]